MISDGLVTQRHQLNSHVNDAAFTKLPEVIHPVLWDGDRLVIGARAGRFCRAGARREGASDARRL